MSLNNTTKTEVALAIQDFYKCVFEFNKIAGNTLEEDQYENQLNTVKEEAKELSSGLLDNNIVLVSDAIADCLFTASFAVGILDGDDYVTKNPPQYLNTKDVPLEHLIPEAIEELANGNMIDFLGLVEDMCVIVNSDMVHNLNSVAESNMSKFPLTSKVSDPDMVCEAIEDAGRYENVYFEESTKFGEPCYVFKATYDKQEKQSYPKGKVVKPPAKYGYVDPSLVVFE